MSLCGVLCDSGVALRAWREGDVAGSKLRSGMSLRMDLCDSGVALRDWRDGDAVGSGLLLCIFPTECPVGSGTSLTTLFMD